MTSTFSWRREEGANWKLMEGRDKKRRKWKAGRKEEGREVIYKKTQPMYKEEGEKERRWKNKGRKECNIRRMDRILC